MYCTLKSITHCVHVRHFCTSALYITGNKAQNVFSVLTPHIDFDERIQNKEELARNLKLRELTHINVDKIEKQWAFYKNIDDTKNVLEYTKLQIGQEINELMKNPEGKEDEIEKLKTHAKLAKNDYKNVREYFYGIEEMTVLKILALPNTLHERTPEKEPEIVHRYLECSCEKSLSHMDLGHGQDLIELSHPSFVYLKNDAALLEVAIINYVNNFMLDSEFTPFSNSNFARSVVVEGCGTEFFNKNEILTLEKNDADETNSISRIHLSGGSSLYSFMAYFTKHLVQLNHFPLKFFAIGRNYMPPKKDDNSLFNLSQYTQINCFLATVNDDAVANSEFDKFVNTAKVFYESLGYHFRMVYLPANEINKNESLRLSIQMFSNHLQKYVEVGYISMYEDFISKRLLFNYNENKVRKYPKVISGNVLNIQKLLACILENNAVADKNEIITDMLKQYIPFQ